MPAWVNFYKEDKQYCLMRSVNKDYIVFSLFVCANNHTDRSIVMDIVMQEKYSWGIGEVFCRRGTTTEALRVGLDIIDLLNADAGKLAPAYKLSEVKQSLTALEGIRVGIV